MPSGWKSHKITFMSRPQPCGWLYRCTCLRWLSKKPSGYSDTLLSSKLINFRMKFSWLQRHSIRHLLRLTFLLIPKGDTVSKYVCTSKVPPTSLNVMRPHAPNLVGQGKAAWKQYIHIFSMACNKIGFMPIKGDLNVCPTDRQMFASKACFREHDKNWRKNQAATGPSLQQNRSIFYSTLLASAMLYYLSLT